MASAILRTSEGRVEILCPHCEEWQDVLDYRNLEMRAKYADNLNPVVKCRTCRHVFSPLSFAQERVDV